MNLEQQLHIFGHLMWIELSTVKGNSSHPNRWKQIHCRSRPPHRRILPHILHPLIPRHFHLWHHTIRLCSQTLWCFGNNDFVKLPTNSGQSVFFQVEVKFFYLNLFDLATFNMAAVPFEVLVRSASCLFRSSASLVQMSFLISVTLRWLIYVITCFSSTLCFEQKLLMFLTLTECSSCKSFKHFLGR